MRYLTIFEKQVESQYDAITKNGFTNHYFEVYDNSFDENKEVQLLIDWLLNMNTFPYTAYIAAYPDMYDDPTTFLLQQQIPFESVVVSSDKKPVYIVTISNPMQLKEVLEEFYWLPQQNELMLITDCKDAVELTPWKVSPKSDYTNLGATLHMQKENCTIIEILHDGQGIGINTACQSPLTAKEICDRFPKGSTVQQWEGDVLIPYEE